MKMIWKVIFANLLLILGMFSSSDQTVLIGMEVMEMEDLLKINHLRNKVGSLEYGDVCRNNAVEDITSDVCFKSNPFLQCVDGVCRCAYVRVDGDDKLTHKQLQYFQGKCRGLQNFPCLVEEHCGEGLTCDLVDISSQEEEESVPLEGKGRQMREEPKQDNLIMEDSVPIPPAPDHVSPRFKFRNRRQMIVKARLDQLSKEPLEADENMDYKTSPRLNGSSRSSHIPDGDVPAVSNDIAFDSPNENPKKKIQVISAIQKSNEKRTCVASKGYKIQLLKKRHDHLHLTALTTLFHLSGWMFCMKSS